MKKLFLMAIIALMLTGCACDQVQPMSNQEPMVESQYRDSNCCNSSYTVRKPVEVIYEETTYTTVYEPKTYTSTRRVSAPYSPCY